MIGRDIALLTYGTNTALLIPGIMYFWSVSCNAHTQSQYNNYYSQILYVVIFLSVTACFPNHTSGEGSALQCISFGIVLTHYFVTVHQVKSHYGFVISSDYVNHTITAELRFEEQVCILNFWCWNVLLGTINCSLN